MELTPGTSMEMRYRTGNPNSAKGLTWRKITIITASFDKPGYEQGQVVEVDDSGQFKVFRSDDFQGLDPSYGSDDIWPSLAVKPAFIARKDGGSALEAVKRWVWGSGWCGSHRVLLARQSSAYRLPSPCTVMAGAIQPAWLSWETWNTLHFQVGKHRQRDRHVA